MPFTAQQIQDAGKIGLDFYLKNKPIDQIGTERPLLKKLMEGKRAFPGGKQFCVEQIRVAYQSNFQWYRGDEVVTYNKRQTIEQASFAWYSAHDGFALDEDRLVQNGITMIDDRPGQSDPKNASRAEWLQLTNLFEEQSATLRLGFEEKFDFELHQDGTQDADSVPGLDHLVSLTPAVGTVGGIDRSTEVYWRNHVSTALTATPSTGNLQDRMEAAWRQCTRNGGKPNLILAGEDFIDGYRNFFLRTYGRVDYGPAREMQVEGGTTQLTFHGVPIVWDPVFADLDAALAPVTPWQKRCYFLNTKHMKLRPVDGQDMVTRKPPRPHNKYEFYWGLTWKGALTMNRGNAHAVLALA